MTTTSRAETRTRKRAPLSARQLSTVSVSPGIHRRHEARMQRREARRVVPGPAAHHREARRAVAREAVQDRAREARGARERGIGVERIRIGEQPVDERHVGRRRHVVDRVGLAVGHARQGLGRRVGGLAGRAVAAFRAAHGDVLDRRVRLAARVIADRALGRDHDALARTLVDDARHARAPDDGAGDRERPVQREPVLAVHDLAVVDAAVRVAHPRARIAQRDRHRRQRDEVALEHVAQRALVDRIAAGAERERVAHRLALGRRS